MQSTENYHRRALVGVAQRYCLISQQVHEFLVDYLNNLLGGIKPTEDIFLERLILDIIYEIFDDLIVDVCFQ